MSARKYNDRQRQEELPVRVIEGTCHTPAGPLYFLVLKEHRIIHLSFSQTWHRRAIQQLPLFYQNVELRRKAAVEKGICNAIRADQHAEKRHPVLPTATSPFIEAGTPFQQRVWRMIGTIPKGKTMTYGDLARRLGKPGAARAVGQACGANPLALIIPCHRVVGTGSLGGFAGGVKIKRQLLAQEGVIF